MNVPWLHLNLCPYVSLCPPPLLSANVAAIGSWCYRIYKFSKRLLLLLLTSLTPAWFTIVNRVVNRAITLWFGCLTACWTTQMSLKKLKSCRVHTDIYIYYNICSLVLDTTFGVMFKRCLDYSVGTSWSRFESFLSQVTGLAIRQWKPADKKHRPCPATSICWCLQVRSGVCAINIWSCSLQLQVDLKLG